MGVILLDYIPQILKTVFPVLFISGIFVYAAVQIIRIGLGVVKYAEKETMINALLQDALIKTEGERITIIKFFGPNRTRQYIPYNFMSARYEAAKKGKEPASHIIDRIPISLYIKFLKNLIKGYIILDTKFPNYEVSEVGYDLVSAQGESKGFYLMLKDIQLKPIGYLTLKKDDDFTQIDLGIMTKLATNLLPLVYRWDDRKAKTRLLYFLFGRK